MTDQYDYKNEILKLNDNLKTQIALLNFKYIIKGK